MGRSEASVTYLEAIRRALRSEMERDSRVILLGEDIGLYGGAFRLTEGFLEAFGPDRVLDTPISEEGFTGVAVGAALAGFRPVVEFQFVDFLASAFNMVTNFAAKSRYRSGTPVPVVLRGPAGGGVRAGPFHSQSPEALFAHTPGIKVAAPATVGDAAGLLRAAIRDDDPVLFLEHKRLYRSLRISEDTFSEAPEVVPLGRARIRRSGGALTIVAYGGAVGLALEAAARLAGEGVEAEVLDLRCLVPLDRESLFESVRRTSRLLVVHEDNLTGGFGAEIAALAAEQVFADLDAPIARGGGGGHSGPLRPGTRGRGPAHRGPGGGGGAPPGPLLSPGRSGCFPGCFPGRFPVRDLVGGVVGTAHQRSGFHMPEPLRPSPFGQRRELRRRHEAAHREVGGSGLEVLPGGEDVHPDPHQVVHERIQFPGGLAESEHDARLRQRPRPELPGGAQEVEGTAVACSRTDLPIEPGHGLHIVVQDFRFLGHHGGEGLRVALEVGNEHLDRRLRHPPPHRPDRLGEDPGAPRRAARRGSPR